MHEFANLLIICIVGMIAGSFGTLVGGGSLIAIPTLIFLGLPPHTAIGTDRLGMTGIGLAGWYKFHKKKLINYKIGFVIAVSTVCGSFLGAGLVLRINDTILKRIIAIITILVLFFITFVKPTMGIEKSNDVVKHYKYFIGAMITFFVGIYAGFYGAGAATFLSYILILLFGQTFLESAGTIKIASFFYTMAAATIFAVNGAIDYSLAVSLFIGTSMGSYVGAHYSDRIGNIWIRRIFWAIVLIMVIKLLI